MSDSSIRNLFAVGYGLLAGAVAFLIAHLPHTSPEYPGEGSIYAPTPWPPPADESAPQPTDGPGLYAANCVACHQENGQGMAPSFPPLAGSEWVTGDPETPVRIALLGVTGPIEVAGQNFNNSMPKLVLTEEQIAKVVNYVRTSWGNSASEVSVDQVKAIKASLGDRTEAWTASELLALRSGGAEDVAGTAAQVDEGADERADEAEEKPVLKQEKPVRKRDRPGLRAAPGKRRPAGAAPQ